MLTTPEAVKTGRNYVGDQGTRYEVRCPQCDGPQFHQGGISACIYCGGRFKIIAFNIIRNAPVKTPEPEDTDS